MANVGLGIVGSQTTGNLKQEVLLASPPFLQAASSDPDALTSEVVQHNNVGTGSNRLISFLLTLHLNLDLEAEATGRLGRLDSVSNAAAAPHVVVLEHGHGAEIHAVGVGSSDEHAVLLDKTESGRGLPSTRHDPRVPGTPQVHQQVPALRSHAGAAGQDVEGHTLALEQAAGGTGHRRQRPLSAVGLDVAALGCVPLDSAAALLEHLVEKGHAGQDSLRLPPESGSARRVADNETADVERRSVLSKPGCYLGLPRNGEDVLEGAVVESHVNHDGRFFSILVFPFFFFWLRRVLDLQLVSACLFWGDMFYFDGCKNYLDRGSLGS